MLPLNFDPSDSARLFILHGDFIFIDIFYPPGEPISRHRLRLSLFDVDNYAFTGRFLVATMTSTRE